MRRVRCAARAARAACVACLAVAQQRSADDELLLLAVLAIVLELVVAEGKQLQVGGVGDVAAGRGARRGENEQSGEREQSALINLHDPFRRSSGGAARGGGGAAAH